MRIKLIDVLLILLLIFLPLALGAVHLWSIVVFATTSVILFNLCVFHPDFNFKEIFRLPVVFVSLIFLAFLLFQLIPFPPAVLRIISPETFKLYSEYSLSYPWVNSWRPLSVYPWISVFELIKLTSCGLIFIVIIFRSGFKNGIEKLSDKEQNILTYLQLGCLTGIFTILLHSFVDFNLHITANAFYFTVLLGLTVAMSGDIDRLDSKFIFTIINIIVIIGFLIALFGIIHKLSGSEKIYWILNKDGYHFGPYINYDHYAGFIGMCASLAIGSFMAKVRFSSFFQLKDKRERLMWLSSKEASLTLRQLFYAIIMVGSLFYSSSRGGILSFTIATLLFYFFIITRTRKSRRGRLVFFVILVAMLAILIVFWIGPDTTFDKFSELNMIVRSIIHEPSILSERRVQMWSNTMNIIKDFPLIGTGFGTFSSIFPKYRTYEWKGEFLRYAHSDYLQLVSETGIIGIIFIIMFLIYFIRLYGANLRRFR